MAWVKLYSNDWEGVDTRHVVGIINEGGPVLLLDGGHVLNVREDRAEEIKEIKERES